MRKKERRLISRRNIDVFDPKDIRHDLEYQADLEYAGFAVKRDDVVNTERLKLKTRRRRKF